MPLYGSETYPVTLVLPIAAAIMGNRKAKKEVKEAREAALKTAVEAKG